MLSEIKMFFPLKRKNIEPLSLYTWILLLWIKNYCTVLKYVEQRFDASDCKNTHWLKTTWMGSTSKTVLEKRLICSRPLHSCLILWFYLIIILNKSLLEDNFPGLSSSAKWALGSISSLDQDTQGWRLSLSEHEKEKLWWQEKISSCCGRLLRTFVKPSCTA